MTNQQRQESWEERFDAELEKLENLYYGGGDGYDKVKKYLESEHNTLFEKEVFPETYFELSPIKVKDFISLALKQKEEEILEMIEGRMSSNNKDSLTDQFKNGAYWEDHEIIKSLITKDK